ncbi:tRNA 2-thiouridine(34) synthase MnmA, partial [Odoribacter sp. OttesenSCG-928-L07]|nr:tRNA 2-thiouridine(34) synthase MnmA [Odoribacter sp. OttesenSCG-928-L07]MDL2241005.1 tRNA 2-thiouridine(34) synthase MnmA [Bacteroidales bacterium OttesenSCG-928-K22]
MKEKILMAMSGGIDSSVAAILLMEQGYDLIGVTFTAFDVFNDNNETVCGNSKAINDAKKLAEQLGFEHHTLDVRKEFKNIVISDFINEYLNGRTPNPCAVCNYTIKWGLLLELANKLNCNYIATGHYAQIINENNRYFLRKGVDVLKDQTYFLWRLSQEQLAKTIFPLGHITKQEVRQIAEQNGFKVLSEKKESQEICFIPDNDYRKFLNENVNNINEYCQEGNFVDTQGKILGKHAGLFNYTVGQRRGLGIALGSPMYVVRLDKTNNNVILGAKEELSDNKVIASEINLMKYEKINNGDEFQTRVRYRSKSSLAKFINNSKGGLTIEFFDMIESITPGQSVVFYEDNDLVGGGV